MNAYMAPPSLVVYWTVATVADQLVPLCNRIDELIIIAVYYKQGRQEI